MKSAQVKLNKLTRWKGKKKFSLLLVNLYWRYSHQVNGDAIEKGPW